MAKPGTDALSGLPSSYADAPKLGPPLPGDLGRPILRAQERPEGAVAPSAADAARQQRLAGIKAARESGLMVQIATTPITAGDRKSVVEGQRVSVRVDYGGAR